MAADLLLCDDLRREAMMYVTVVIFYEGLLLMKRREILFGVDIQTATVLSFSWSFVEKSPSCSFSRRMFVPL